MKIRKSITLPEIDDEISAINERLLKGFVGDVRLMNRLISRKNALVARRIELQCPPLFDLETIDKQYAKHD